MTPYCIRDVYGVYLRVKDDSPEGAGSRKRTLEHMERYAREGLRTLLVGSAELDRDWFVEWERR